MLIMDCGVDTIINKRRRPNKIIIYTKIAYRVFSYLPIKKLPRPALIYYYNIDISAVNREN